MARYCGNCGKPLDDASMFCGFCGAKATDRKTPSLKQGFVKTDTLSKAYDIAKTRNAEDWSYWDSPSIFSFSMRKVEKFCIKEDKRLEKDPDKPVYFVSPHGAIGQCFQEEGKDILEWLFYTQIDGPANLPQNYISLFE